jgi:hypothetical protein
MKRLTLIFALVALVSCDRLGSAPEVNVLKGGLKCHHCKEHVIFVDSHNNECKANKNKF